MTDNNTARLVENLMGILVQDSENLEELRDLTHEILLWVIKQERVGAIPQKNKGAYRTLVTGWVRRLRGSAPATPGSKLEQQLALALSELTLRHTMGDAPQP